MGSFGQIWFVENNRDIYRENLVLLKLRTASYEAVRTSTKLQQHEDIQEDVLALHELSGCDWAFAHLTKAWSYGYSETVKKSSRFEKRIWGFQP